MLALSGVAMVMAIGVAGVWARRSGPGWAGAIVAAFVEVIHNAPFLVRVFFALPLVGLRLSPTATAIVALGLKDGA